MAHRDHLERLIECAVCMDTTEDPRRLQCGHSFCYACLQALWTSSQPTSKVRCPQCRKEQWLGYDGPRNIPKDFIIQQIKEMLQSFTQDGTTETRSRSACCAFCLKGFKSTAHYLYCLECDSLICSDCSKHHCCSKDSNKLGVVQLDFQYSLICSSHHYPVRFICDVCNSVLCKRCQVQGVCGTHDLFDVFLGRFINDDGDADGKPKRKPKSKLITHPKIPGANVVANLLSGPDKTKEVQKPVVEETIIQEVKPKVIAPPAKVTPSKAKDSKAPKSGTPKVTPKSTPNPTPHPTPQLSERPTSQYQAPTSQYQAPTPSRILPWQKDLSFKGRSVCILPSEDYVIITEKSG